MKYLKATITPNKRYISEWDESLILYALELAHIASGDYMADVLAIGDLERLNSGETVTFDFAKGSNEFSIATQESMEELRQQEEACLRKFGLISDDETLFYPN